MSQRQKVLDTDSTTAKFLYAIIKQTDLKSIDWNRVASDLQVSNGHAARMRYSRFRQQMEGTAMPRTKRKSKKAKIVDPPVETPNMFPMNQPHLMPTMMPSMTSSSDSNSQSNPFIKSEPNTQSSSMPSQIFYGSQLMPEGNMNQQQYYPQDFSSIQFQHAINMQHGTPPSSEDSPDSSMNAWPVETMPTSYPYGMQANFGVQDFGMQSHYQSLPSGLTWDQQPAHMGGPVIKSEQVQQSSSAMDWEPYRSSPQHVAATRPEAQHQSSTVMWPLQSSARQDIPVTAQENQNQPTPALKWEPQVIPRQTSPIIKNDEQQEAHLNIFCVDPLPIPQEVPTLQNAEQQERKTITTWTSMPPSQVFPAPQSEDISQGIPDNTSIPMPAPTQAALAEDLTKALVLWRPTALPPTPPPSITPTTDFGSPRATQPLAVCHARPAFQDSIPVISIDEDVMYLPGRT